MISTRNKTGIRAIPTEFRKRLLRWFELNRRDLPWRRNVTPYSVWISEIMLQQTVVATVIPHFIRWMREFPDMRALAEADEQEVLKLWEGLGYYSRARNICRAAKMMMERYDGQLPKDYDKLMGLPGIGEYTAAAIMSIAFGKRHPVIDANVRRVVNRLRALRLPDRQSEGSIRAFLMRALPRTQSGEFNEAIMELGQTVCLSHKPTCGICPVVDCCQAFARDLQHEIPARKKTESVKKISRVLLVVSRGRILARRKPSGIFAGLWLLPTIPPRQDVETILRTILGKSLNVKTRNDLRLRSRTHHYTHYVERLFPVICEVNKASLSRSEEWCWLRLAEIDRYPFPSVYRRILDEFSTA
jgi:A/G-specific adenine glycosylase